jgi:hypothetical protein
MSHSSHDRYLREGGDPEAWMYSDAIDDDAEEMRVEGGASAAEAADANGQSREAGGKEVTVTELTALDEVGEVWL